MIDINITQKHKKIRKTYEKKLTLQLKIIKMILHP